ncbi:MAG: hypothetical protein Q8P80_03830 [Candidatus Levybacteria bacterium]|nr:hypothetical protein [Candidatus Levybacteria bacterium]
MANSIDILNKITNKNRMFVRKITNSMEQKIPAELYFFLKQNFNLIQIVAAFVAVLSGILLVSPKIRRVLNFSS